MADVSTLPNPMLAQEDEGGAGEDNGKGGEKETVAELLRTINGLQAKVDQLSQRREEHREEPDEEEPTVEMPKVLFGETEDIEGLPRHKHSNELLKRAHELSKFESAQVAKQVEGLQNTVQQLAGQVIVMAFEKSHPDVHEWQQEIMPLVKKGMTLEDAYDLARSKNAKKARELDKKHAPRYTGRTDDLDSGDDAPGSDDDGGDDELEGSDRDSRSRSRQPNQRARYTGLPPTGTAREGSARTPRTAKTGRLTLREGIAQALRETPMRSQRRR